MDFLGDSVACVRFGTKIQYNSDFRNQWSEMLKRYLYFYIVILKCYQTAIQYVSKVALSLVVSPRHDMKLTRPISGFMQKIQL